MAYSQMGSGFSGWNTDTTRSSFEKEANILLSAFKKHRSVAFGLHDTAPAKTQVEGVRGTLCRLGDSLSLWSRALYPMAVTMLEGW